MTAEEIAHTITQYANPTKRIEVVEDIVRRLVFENFLSQPDIIELFQAALISLRDELNNKADLYHIHSIDNVTGLRSEINDKANSIHSHSLSQISDWALDPEGGIEMGVDGLAVNDLDGGVF